MGYKWRDDEFDSTVEGNLRRPQGMRSARSAWAQVGAVGLPAGGPVAAVPSRLSWAVRQASLFELNGLPAGRTKGSGIIAVKLTVVSNPRCQQYPAFEERARSMKLDQWYIAPWRA
jgi:hypothetical protein